MSEMRYTKDHEWLRVEGQTATVGITDYAQTQLGDVVYVELPEPGVILAKGGEAAVVESVKAASEVYSPASGEVTQANQALVERPGAINTDATGEGWFYKIRLTEPAQVAELMDQATYDAYLAELG
ncbi:MAG: glycine cleavage system protein GcvH [Alphaproteobacteria bacterium]|nr:glycine cleavage system protein GcvH [Alphaproteobacteria bacterium]